MRNAGLAENRKNNKTKKSHLPVGSEQDVAMSESQKVMIDSHYATLILEAEERGTDPRDKLDGHRERAALLKRERAAGGHARGKAELMDALCQAPTAKRFC
jgi:hypothetical protein